MENFFNQMMENVFEVANETPIEWPSDFTKQQKIQLLTKLIEYFTSKEDYGRCAGLKAKLKEVQLQKNNNNKGYGKEETKDSN